MECNGTTYVGVVEDNLGEIRYVYCDACRTIAVDAWDARRRRRIWGITYVDPKTISASARQTSLSAGPVPTRGRPPCPTILASCGGSRASSRRRGWRWPWRRTTSLGR